MTSHSASFSTDFHNSPAFQLGKWTCFFDDDLLAYGDFLRIFDVSIIFFCSSDDFFKCRCRNVLSTWTVTVFCILFETTTPSRTFLAFLLLSSIFPHHEDETSAFLSQEGKSASAIFLFFFEQMRFFDFLEIACSLRMANISFESLVVESFQLFCGLILKSAAFFITFAPILFLRVRQIGS